MDGWMDGWIDGWMGGWIDGWMPVPPRRRWLAGVKRQRRAARTRADAMLVGDKGGGGGGGMRPGGILVVGNNNPCPPSRHHISFLPRGWSGRDEADGGATAPGPCAGLVLPAAAAGKGVALLPANPGRRWETRVPWGPAAAAPWQAVPRGSRARAPNFQPRRGRHPMGGNGRRWRRRPPSPEADIP